jgi:hypothetical protein
MDIDPDAPQRFPNIGFAAGWAAAITVVCVIVGQGAEQFAGAVAPTNAPATASNDDAARTQRFNAIDYAVTGAIKGQTVVIGPCTAANPGH